MENSIEIHFIKENIDLRIDIQQPDLMYLVHSIVVKHLDVTEDNVVIETKNEKFDTEGFKEILIEVHEEFCQEIDKFYNNIENEIKTYYEDEELSNYIIESLKELEKDEK